MSKILTFDDAIADSATHAKRHLLLGNGFSIGCRAEIFHYASLYAEADFSKIPDVQLVFETLGTKDFEVAIKALESSAKLLPIYAPKDVVAAKTMLDHASALKDVLVTTIAGNHPDLPSSIAEEEFWACRKFLNNFLGPENDGQVYTLNYDLLLYWTLMHEDMEFEETFELSKNDGFGNDEDDPNADYVVWQGETASHSARVHFLHGALHLFDAGSELKKYTWVRNGNPLIVQARDAMNANAFPLFVAEGTSVQKKEKIRHNAYLYQCFKQFTANASIGTHCFFIFGHSLAENDDHILTRLGRGRFKTLYVGLFGKPGSPENMQIIKRAQGLSALRQDRYPLEVKFYDSATANVWKSS